MPRVVYITPSGEQREVYVSDGSNLMRTAVKNNIDSLNECGACMTCATCHVYVENGGELGLPPPGDEEQELLSWVPAEHRPESRLACQIIAAPALEKLVIRMPEKQA